MSTKVENEWRLLANFEQWLVEYRPDSRVIRLKINDKIMYLEREAYQLLWGMMTQGLDELEREEDKAARLLGREPSMTTLSPQLQPHNFKLVYNKYN
jgi:hypothetical protein